MIASRILPGLVVGLALLAEAVMAQQLDVPITVPAGDGQAAVCASDRVAGLDPNGDGFLAVRSGPGAQYRQIDSLHNGDVVVTCEMRGQWHGIFYGSGNARRGWVHGNWLTPLAG